MDSSKKAFKIEIKSAGDGERWWNNKIGHIYEAHAAKHPCNPTVRGFLVNGSFFIPGKHAEIHKEITDIVFLVKRSKSNSKRYSKKGYRSSKINAFNIDNNTEQTFSSITEAALILNIPRTTLNKYVKISQPYNGLLFYRAD